MRKKNYPLIFGSIIILIILYTIFFPKTLTSINPYAIDTVKSITNSGGVSKIQGAPFSPSKNYPLGSDMMGRDVLSLIIYGTKLTIELGVFIALFRFLIAIPVGIAAGFGNKLSNTIIDHMSAIFSAVPVLITAVIILNLGIFSSMYKVQSMIVFIVVLTLLDFPRLAGIIRERVSTIINSSFVKCEISIGKKESQIALENIIPHLMPELIVLFFIEIARTLTILMQLGIFSVFIGNLKFVGNGDGENLQFQNITFEPEWSSMLSSTISIIYSAPWTVIWPALAFFASILGFNFFGEGLRIEFQKKDSKFITWTRRLLTFDSAKKEWFKKYLKIILASALTVCILIVMTNIYNNNRYDIDKASNINVKGLSKEAVIGTKEVKNNSEVLAKAISAIGGKPLYKENYYMNYSISKVSYVENATCDLIDKGWNKTLKLGQDYFINDGNAGNYNGEIYDGTKKDMINFTEYGNLKGKVLLINGENYSQDTTEDIVNNIYTNSSCICVVIMKEKLEDNGGVYEFKKNKPVIYLKNGILNGNNDNLKMTLNFTTKPVGGRGINVAGIIPGYGKANGKEAIILGASYNYRKDDYKIAIKKIEFVLKLAQRIKALKIDRSIIILFYDGGLSDITNGKFNYAPTIPYPVSKSVLYIDTGDIKGDNFDKLLISSDQTPITRYFAYNFNYHLKKSIESKGIEIGKYNERDIDTVLLTSPKSSEEMYYSGSIPTINLSTTTGNRNTLKDLGSAILKAVDKIYY